ncbi:type II secretion system secretin GspD [Dissulfurimicrobium hydrothermale]|uniref:type II secretion system secretin GspD n=1 Tax=Dissulfurimicrobium hydrothermale TaxID=1750598 RepID=UPI001EDBF1E1|nr:type II secretion system secretin GspD [Dissulfurimicrobium hydrothermale]UKL14000.1 type II secretion system secretin GspD [Dissulfurimicrobium hydrothermale]
MKIIGLEMKVDIIRLFSIVLIITLLSNAGYSFGQDKGQTQKGAQGVDQNSRQRSKHIDRPSIPVAVPGVAPARSGPQQPAAAQPPMPIQPTASAPAQNQAAPSVNQPPPAQGQAAVPLPPNPVPLQAPQAQPQASVSPFAGASPLERKPIDITLDNMDIYPVLDLVLSQILGLNYVVDPAIKGVVSLHIQGSYTRDELLNLFNSVLQIHGLGITKGEHGLYKVVRKPDTARTGPIVINRKDALANPGDVVQIFQLKYLSATAAASNLKNFLSQGAVIVPEPSTNSLLISDTAENIDKIGSILTFIDTDIFKDYHWRLFTLENASVTDVYDDIEKLIQGKVIYGRAGLDQSAFQILPLKTINSILVVTKWKDVLDVVGNWIKEFDQRQADKGKQVYVYFVQNGKAKDIADMLNELYGIRGASRSSASKTDKNKTVMVERTKTEKPAAVAKPEGISGTGELAGDVEIIPDETNNAILVRARPRDYKVISDVIKKIDVVPRQVLIEVLIVDVTLNDNFQYGVEWFLKNKGLNFGGTTYNADVALTDGTTMKQNTPLGTGPTGLTYSLFDNAGGLRALISALAQKTTVNILSSPTILAVDNQESKIESGDEVPTLTGTTTTEGGTTTQSVQYRNAGIILKVKPSINDGGLVRMEVTQEVSSVTSMQTGGLNSPSFRTRKATTYMVAKDGQTIIMGGLIQTQKTKSNSGIPYLKDIPILGHLFGDQGVKTSKTELMFAITPYLIKTREDADALTLDFSKRVKELKEALKKKSISGLGTKATEAADSGKGLEAPLAKPNVQTTPENANLPPSPEAEVPAKAEGPAARPDAKKNQPIPPAGEASPETKKQ